MENNEVKATDFGEHNLSETTQKDFELLKECLKQTEEGGISISLVKFGFMGYTEINDYTSVKVTNAIGIADGYIRLITTFKNKKDFGMKQIIGIYRQYLRENTKELVNQKGENLFLTVELVKNDEKKNMYHSIKLYNPFICLSENDNAVHFVFSLENMTFGKYEMDYSELLNEIEVEAESNM